MRVAISGYYGFGNTGDEAIALAITQQLKKHNVQPLLLSDTPEETALLYNCESAHRMQPAALLRALSRSQVLLSGGGGLLQDKTSTRTLDYYLMVIRAAKLLRKRVVIFNQSIGPLSEQGRKKVAATLPGTQIIVRDQGSLDTLQNMGLRAELGGDPALLLKPWPNLKRDLKRVIIAPRGDIRDATERLTFVTKILQAEGRHVTALSFMPEQDDEAARALGANEVISTRDPQVALDTISGSGFVIGVRLHAVILAAAASVPFSGVAYDPKVLGFCADAGASAWPTTLDPATVTEETLRRVNPDWNAVEDMKLRAANSFSRALQLV